MRRGIFHKGYFPSFSLFGVPVSIHWSFPAAGIFLSIFLGNSELGYILPLIAAYTLLIIFHEFGHAIGAWSAGMKVYEITIDASGGWCRADEPRHFKQKFFLYAGGLLTQLAVFMVTVFFLAIFGQPSNTALNLTVFVFTVVNGILFVTNLIPYGENDGKKIYNLIKQEKF